MSIKLAFGMPILDSVPGEAVGFHFSLIAETARHIERGRFVTITPLNLVPHDRARAFILLSALELGCDELLFIDDDTVAPPWTYPRLKHVMEVNRKERNLDVAAVSGHYYRRGFPYTCVWSITPGLDEKGEERWLQVEAKDGVHTIHTSGLGCCLIDLNWVKARLKPPYFTSGQDVNGANAVKDDISFFDKIRAAGGVLLGDATLRCGHVGGRIIIADDSADMLRKYELSSGLVDVTKPGLSEGEAHNGSSWSESSIRVNIPGFEENLQKDGDSPQHRDYNQLNCSQAGSSGCGDNVPSSDRDLREGGSTNDQRGS